MKSIKFYRIAVPPPELKKLTARRNLPGLLQSLGILLMYAGTTAASFYFFSRGQWVAMIIAAYVHSVLMSFMGMEASVHELSHKTAFKTKWLNEFFYGLFALLTWNNPIHFRESHRRHHQYTMHRGLDKEVVIQPGAFGALDYLSWFIFDYKKFAMIMRGNVSFILGRDVPDVFSWDPLFEKDDPRRKKMFLWARLQLLFHLGLTVFFALQGWYVLIYTVSFSYFFATFLARSCEIVQHQGMPSDVADWRASCHTMKFGPVMSFLYWRMNYHTEHHMYASVPFWKLHRLHKQIRHELPDPVRGYLRGVGQILGYIRRQRSEPEWTYEAKIPG